jgi:hypothetical protein
MNLAICGFILHFSACWRLGQRKGQRRMLANNAEMPAGSPAVGRGKVRFLTLEGLDGRTIAARRAAQLAKGFEAELGGTLSATQRLAVEQASALAAIAEDAQARRLAGDMTISLEDLVRATNAATRAVRALNIQPAAAPTPPASPAEYLASRGPPSDTEVHPEAPHEAGEASSGEPSE